MRSLDRCQSIGLRREQSWKVFFRGRRRLPADGLTGEVAFAANGAQTAHQREVRLARGAGFVDVSQKEAANESRRRTALQIGIVKIASQQIAKLPGNVFELGPTAANALIQRPAYLVALRGIDFQQTVQQ